MTYATTIVANLRVAVTRSRPRVITEPPGSLTVTPPRVTQAVTNQRCRLSTWIKDADQILAKLNRQSTSATGH